MSVQLKTVTGNGMKAVQRNVIDANKSLQKAGYRQAELYIDATQTSIVELKLIVSLKLVHLSAIC